LLKVVNLFFFSLRKQFDDEEEYQQDDSTIYTNLFVWLFL